MNEIRDLIARSFNLWVQKRWLRTIEKELKLMHKHLEKSKRHEFVAKELMAEYQKRYPDRKENDHA